MNKDHTLTLDELTFSVGLDELLVQPLSYKTVQYIGLLIDKIRCANTAEGNNPLLQFVWAFEAKDVAILLRNSTVQLLKLEQYMKDGLRTDEDLQHYQSTLQNIIHDATYLLMQSYCRKAEGQEPVKEEWGIQNNPSLKIIEQLEDLKDQVKKIQRSQIKLDQLNQKFADYRDAHAAYMDQRRSRAASIHEHLLQIKEQAMQASEDAQLDKASVSRILVNVEYTIGKLDNQDILSSYEYIVVEDTDRLNIAVDAKHGKLEYKSVDILSEISGWNSFNLAAPLKAVDAKLHSYNEKVLAGLYQLLNRLKAKLDTSRGEVLVEKADITQQLDRFLAIYEADISPNVTKKLDELQGELDTLIVPSQLFSQEHLFLPSSTLGQLAGFAEQSNLEKRYSISKIRTKISGALAGLFSKYAEGEKLTTAGYINKILCFNPESDVNALFLRKGFLGSSFTIERPQLETRIRNHFELWQAGYGGALLIHGGHGTGRSTTIELLPLLFPEVESHHFVIGQKIDINGHTHVLDYNLVEAIKFVHKYSGETRCIVTIDDIEQFSNTPEATYDLFTDLISEISKYNRRIYFAISCHKFLERHLQHYFDLSSVFTESISTDHMATSDIQEAVITRAHAVVNHEDVVANSDILSSTARKVSRKANNNVGRAMQLWCMQYNGDFDDSGNSATFRRDVLRHKALLMLLFKHGKVYEPYIKSMLDEIDAKELKANITTLTRCKMLVRPEVGYISVNPYLQSTIEAIIK